MRVTGRLCVLRTAGWLSGAAALLVVLLGPTASQAQPPGEADVGEVEDCQVGDTLTFDAGSTAINLDAQARLNLALQWVQQEPGRHLLVLGADGPRPEDARLGKVRASAAVMFIINGGANPSVVSRGDLRDLGPSRERARADVDSVVLVNCDVTEPVP
jgi:outer membrane protein OmpA-like peptidoglycan-associated protein